MPRSTVTPSSLCLIQPCAAFWSDGGVVPVCLKKYQAADLQDRRAVEKCLGEVEKSRLVNVACVRCAEVTTGPTSVSSLGTSSENPEWDTHLIRSSRGESHLVCHLVFVFCLLSETVPSQTYPGFRTDKRKKEARQLRRHPPRPCLFIWSFGCSAGFPRQDPQAQQSGDRLHSLQKNSLLSELSHTPTP